MQLICHTLDADSRAVVAYYITSGISFAIPTCRKDEKLVSEIFVMKNRSGKALRRPVNLQLPHYRINADYYTAVVMTKPCHSEVWHRNDDNIVVRSMLGYTSRQVMQ